MRGNSVVITTFLLLTLLCIPLCCEGSDAVDENTCKVSMPGMPGHSGVNYIELGNGHSRDFVIYFENYDEHPLDVAFFVLGDNAYVHGSDIGNLTVPAGSAESPVTVKEVFTISVDHVAPAQDGVFLALDLCITDLYDDTFVLLNIRFSVDVVSAFDASGEFNRFFGIVDNSLPAPFNTAITPFIATVIGFIVIGAVAAAIAIPILYRFTDHSHVRKRRLSVIIAIASISISLIISMDLDFRILGSDYRTIHGLEEISLIALIVALCVSAWYIYMGIIRGIVRKVDFEDRFAELSLLPVFEVFGKLLFWILGTAAVLTVLEVDITGLLVGTGLVALSISLGSQHVFSQFLNGVIIHLTRRFRVGDYIEFNEKVYIVKSVRIMYTELMGTKKDRIITVPNDKMASATTVNSDIEFDKFRAIVSLTVSREMGVHRAEEALLKFVDSMEGLLTDPEVILEGITGSGINLKLKVTTPFYFNERKIILALAKRMEEYGLSMPYERIDVAPLRSDHMDEKGKRSSAE